MHQLVVIYVINLSALSLRLECVRYWIRKSFSTTDLISLILVYVSTRSLFITSMRLYDKSARKYNGSTIHERHNRFSTGNTRYEFRDKVVYGRFRSHLHTLRIFCNLKEEIAFFYPSESRITSMIVCVKSTALNQL